MKKINITFFPLKFGANYQSPPYIKFKNSYIYFWIELATAHGSFGGNLELLAVNDILYNSNNFEIEFPFYNKTEYLDSNRTKFLNSFWDNIPNSISLNNIAKYKWQLLSPRGGLIFIFIFKVDGNGFISESVNSSNNLYPIKFEFLVKDDLEIKFTNGKIVGKSFMSEYLLCNEVLKNYTINTENYQNITYNNNLNEINININV